MIEWIPINASWSRISCEKSIAMELYDAFSFLVPDYQHMPLYKSGFWDGKIKLFDPNTHKIYTGLKYAIKDFAGEREYSFIEPEEAIPGWNPEGCISSLGLRMTPRDYQEDAFIQALYSQRGMTILPTSSGKTLVMYMLAKWHMNEGKKILIVEPKINLVNQTKTALFSYGAKEEDLQTIQGGMEKGVSSPITISTWQSIYKLPRSWFEQFDVVIGDEVHGFKAQSLTKIMEKSINAYYRYGFTGTLDDSKTHRMALEGLFGVPYRPKDSKGGECTTSRLMDEGYVSPLRVTILVLDYSDEDKKALRKLKSSAGRKGSEKYQAEVDFLISHEVRNKFIANLAKQMHNEGNALLLFNRVEDHGEVLQKLLEDKDVTSYFVAGKTPGEDREKIRAIASRENNILINASMGVFKEGVDIPSIRGMIFAYPGKAKIATLQAIGRGLRIHPGKEKCELIDLADDLSSRNNQCFSMRHLKQRVELYAKEGFDYRIIRVSI